MSRIRVGGDTPSSIRVGGNVASRVYVGTELVWSAAPQVTVRSSKETVSNGFTTSKSVAMPPVVEPGDGLLVLFSLANSGANTTVITITPPADFAEVDSVIGPAGAGQRLFRKVNAPKSDEGALKTFTLSGGVPTVALVVSLANAHTTEFIDAVRPLAPDTQNDASADPATAVAADVRELSLRSRASGTTQAEPPATPPDGMAMVVKAGTLATDANAQAAIAVAPSLVAAGGVTPERFWPSGYGASRTVLIKPAPASTSTLVSRLELPYDVPSTSTLRSSAYRVYPHWFHPYLVSENNAAAPDYADRFWLPPGAIEGEGQSWEKDHREYGGLFRDRPIHRAPLDSATYRSLDRRTQIKQMHDAGRDGAFNEIVALSGTYWTRVTGAYDDVDALGLSGIFDMIPMFDVSGGGVNWSVDATVTAIKELNGKPASLKIDGRLQVSIFKPEAKSVSHWQAVIDGCKAAGIAIDLIACYVGATATHAPTYDPVMKIHGRWGDRDPVTLNRTGTQNRGQAQYVWDEFGKNTLGHATPGDDRPRETKFWEPRGTEAYRVSWDAATVGNGTSKGKCLWIQEPTLNDYAEGSTIEPSRNAGWSWLDLSWYDLIRFKTGSVPKVVRDTLYLMHRVGFTSNMVYTAGSAYTRKPQLRVGGTPETDIIEVLVFHTSDATVHISRGTGATATTTSHAVTGAGRTAIQVPLLTGPAGSISARMSRDSGATTVPDTLVTSPWAVSRLQQVQDMNPRIGSSRRGWSATYPDAIPDQSGIPLNLWYAGGAQPTGALLSLQQIARRRYDAFMSYCLTQTGMVSTMPAGAYRIQSPNQGFHPTFVLNATVSEGMGYGMLLNAWLSNRYLPDGVRVDGRAIFDGLWTYYKFYKDVNGLMHWHIGPDGVVQNEGGASDGDFDTAMALIVAHRVWGSGGAVNYAAEATALINAIRDFEFTPATYTGVGGPNVMMNGDLWGVDTDRYMPDYFRPAWFREFQRHTGDARWGDIIAKNYPLALGYFFNNFTGGVVPDNCTRAGLAVTGESYLAGYNAVRLGFGVATDFLWNTTTADALSYNMMHRMIGRAKALWPLGGDTKAPTYDLNLTTSEIFGNGAGWGMFGPATLVDAAHSTYAAEILAKIDADTELSYFNMGLSAMASMVMAGIAQPG
jgi:hypothetical protein